MDKQQESNRHIQLCKLTSGFSCAQFVCIFAPLMDYSMFRLKSYSDDDCGPDDAIPSFRRNFCLAYCNFMM